MRGRQHPVNIKKDEMKRGVERQQRSYISEPMRDFEGEVERIYGFHPVTEALANPRRKFVKLLATKNAADRITSKFKAEVVLPKELDRLVGADAVHQGLILDAAPLKQPRLDQIERKGLILLLDQVTDPHNVGAIMRSCAAFGATALVTTARHSPEASGVLFKAASGAYEHVPYVKVTNLARAMAELKEYGFSIIGLDSEAENPIEALELPQPIAVVLGAEGKGMRHLTKETCDAVVRLDMPGAIKSLNVSNAAVVALYALTRRKSPENSVKILRES
jgi:23S rRNA (guanosine2251-2'-O)-methyltransferase